MLSPKWYVHRWTVAYTVFRVSRIRFLADHHKTTPCKRFNTWLSNGSTQIGSPSKTWVSPFLGHILVPKSKNLSLIYNAKVVHLAYLIGSLVIILLYPHRTSFSLSDGAHFLTNINNRVAHVDLDNVLHEIQIIFPERKLVEGWKRSGSNTAGVPSKPMPFPSF